MDALDFLRALPDNFAQCMLTSPPYYDMRNYMHDEQIGNERSYKDYIARLILIFDEARRVLRHDGIFWLNIGDTYTKSHNTHDLPKKNLMLIPERVAIGCQDRGWIIRQVVIWHKVTCFPESVKDRPTRNHEYIYMMTKEKHYYYDQEAIAQKSPKQWGHKPQKRGKHVGITQSRNPEFKKHVNRMSRPVIGKSLSNRRSVWTISREISNIRHFATMPIEIAELCIKASTRVDDIVLDMFMGAGTTALVAKRLDRQFIGSEINPDYIDLTYDRISKDWEANQLRML